jgi:hypothetical protein
MLCETNKKIYAVCKIEVQYVLLVNMTKYIPTVGPKSNFACITVQCNRYGTYDVVVLSKKMMEIVK